MKVLGTIKSAGFHRFTLVADVEPPQ